MHILCEPAQAEIAVKRSRFIADALPAASPAEAKLLLKAQRARHPGARHMAYAFAVGERCEHRSLSDGGEPPGTAGRPIMDALSGKSFAGGECCTNVLLTVTRYFGGILLGTGGLARAYGDAAKAVAAACRTQELVARSRFAFSVGYGGYEQAARFLASLGAEDVNAAFEAGVRLGGFIPACAEARLAAFVAGLTDGREAARFERLAFPVRSVSIAPA
ncbi:YigZ family protein [Treponema endosymbiont of Eucomonympha sp.]|uniref:YigZ family protein n=1 Tax=Treponema endosymbiont of Eucomonympha sp. TaxID=1580831 RepID=UPI0007831D4C|nr:YigZ family protein [Treponema endosymbiont of Eucomonympha sp.]